MKTQPIKNEQDIKLIADYFLSRNEWRNYALFILGINTALRIGDLLKLKWNDVYDFQKKEFKTHIRLIEQKTAKWNQVALNNSAQNCLGMLLLHEGIKSKDYIFKSQQGDNRPINRNRAYVLLKNAAISVGVPENISCHSLRKTFGYHAWKKGVSPALIMEIYNHSSMSITKRYLSIDQDEKDEVFQILNL